MQMTVSANGCSLLFRQITMHFAV